MVETNEIKNEILRALDRILINENSDVLVRKLDLIIAICETKKREIREKKFV